MGQSTPIKPRQRGMAVPPISADEAQAKAQQLFAAAQSMPLDTLSIVAKGEKEDLLSNGVAFFDFAPVAACVICCCP